MNRFWLTRLYGNDGTSGAGASPPAPPPPPPASKSFTQDELNAILAKERRAYQTKEAELLARAINPEEHEKLKTELEEIRKQTMTEAERRALEHKKELDKYKLELEAAKQGAEAASKTLTHYQVETALMSAAAKVQAYNPEQLKQLFMSSAKVVPQLGPDGKPTGQNQILLSTILDGKEISGTPQEVFALLKGSDAYANMFVARGAAGLGGNNNPGTGGQVDMQRMKTDLGYYKSIRSKK